MNEYDIIESKHTMRHFDKIGFWGPIILFVTTAVQLWGYHGFFATYIIIFITNIGINKIIKAIVRQPRPNNGESITSYEKYTGIEAYGMPSGHAQSIFSSITFLHLVKGSPFWLIMGLFIAGLTIFQRWKYNRHTIEQLMVGSVIGIVVAYSGYYITKNHLRENTYVKNVE